jgi:hypothetical protein
MKTRDAARLRLAAARYLFARYPVAEHLEQIWMDCSGLGRDEIVLRKRWYIVAAGGGSLYREGAGAWLSRKEVHAFLNAPPGLGLEAAIWRAIARSYSNDPGIALRIARSRIAQSPRTELGFWREVPRFFCVHPATVKQMDDLRDYLADCYRRNPLFSLKGRTLASLSRQMREWHRDLEPIARIEAARHRVEAARARARGQASAPEASVGGSWRGAAVADWSWSPAVKDRAKREAYLVIELRTAADLVAETRHAPLRRELRGQVHCGKRVDLVAAPPRRRVYRATADNRARPLAPGDPGARIRQPHGAHRGGASSWSAGPRRAGSAFFHSHSPRRETLLRRSASRYASAVPLALARLRSRSDPAQEGQEDARYECVTPAHEQRFNDGIRLRQLVDTDEPLVPNASDEAPRQQGDAEASAGAAEDRLDRAEFQQPGRLDAALGKDAFEPLPVGASLPQYNIRMSLPRKAARSVSM